MKQAVMKERLHRFIETVGEKKVKAIYTLFEKDIEEDEWEYTDEFKEELDSQYAYYLNGGKMIAAADASKQINALVKKIKNK